MRPPRPAPMTGSLRRQRPIKSENNNLHGVELTERPLGKKALRAVPTGAIKTRLRIPGSREAKGATHVHDSPAADNHVNARAVRRRAHRLRARPLEALWQQRRRVPQGA